MKNMGTQGIDYEQLYEIAKPVDIRLGNIVFSVDTTMGLTKEQWIERYIRQEDVDRGMWVTKNGRIIIPSMGIY